MSKHHTVTAYGKRIDKTPLTNLCPELNPGHKLEQARSARSVQRVQRVQFVQLPAACPVMRLGVWLSRFAMLLSVAATAHLQNVISAFLQDLALVQQWRSLTLVHCSGE